MITVSKAIVTVSVYEESSAFLRLRDSWQDMYQSSPTSTPYQSWEWLSSWWEYYGSPSGGRLRLIAVHEGDVLIGLAPLMLRGCYGLRRLVFLGTPISDNLDVIARGGRERDVAHALVKYLRSSWSLPMLDLEEVREGGVAEALAATWGSPGIRIEQSICPSMPIKPWNDLVAALPRKRRETARKTIRRADQLGLGWKPVPTERTVDATERWLELHRRYWRGRGITQEHETARFAAHLNRSAMQLQESGLARVYELVRCDDYGGVTIAGADMVLVGHDFATGYISGFADEIPRQFEVNTLLVRLWVDVALEHGVPVVSMGRGVEPYKTKWCSQYRTNYRIMLGRPTLQWMAITGYYIIRRWAAKSSLARVIVHQVLSAHRRIINALHDSVAGWR